MVRSITDPMCSGSCLNWTWPRFDLRELKQVFENQIEPVALLQNDVEKTYARFRVILAAVQERLNIALDRRERRAQFMRHIGDEVFSDMFQPAEFGDVVEDEDGAGFIVLFSPGDRGFDIEAAPAW